MNIIEDFRFYTNVSIDTYQSKQEATACLSRAGSKAVGKSKMAFMEQNVTVADFLNLATSGHTFCNLYDFDPNEKYWIEISTGKHYPSYPVYKRGANKGAMKITFKSDQFFKGSQTVFVDVDFTKYQTIPEYISTLTIQPTCVYMSFSDNKDKHGVISRRFRLVYVLDELVGKDKFERISRAISDRIVLDTGEPMDDDCGTRVSQYMNGVFGNSETYQTNCIYSVSDFIGEGVDYIDSPQPQNEVEQGKPQIDFNDQMLVDMATMEYSQFMHYYSIRYKYFYRIEREDWIDGLYQLTDENYLQLWYFREKQVDGQMRRRKLFKNACLRRLMSPNIDHDTLLFNLYVDFVRFFDNSDKVITLDTLKRKVINAMKMTQEQLEAYCHWEIRYWHDNRPKFICKPGIITTRGQISYIGKVIRWAEIEKRYDRTKSIGENAELLEVPLRTLYRFCEEKWIETSPNKGMTKEERRKAKREDKDRQIKLFKKLYDPDLSLRENMEILRENGLELGKSTIARWIDEYISDDPMPVSLPKIELPELKWSFPKAENYSYTVLGEEEFGYKVSDWDLANVPQSQDAFIEGAGIKWGLPEITFDSFLH